MNTITKILLISVALALAGFFLEGPGGKPHLSLEKLKWWSEQAEEKGPEIQNFAKEIKDKIPVIESPFKKSGGDGPIYKWRDQDGIWHYSDVGNPDGDAEIMERSPENEPIIPDPPKYEDEEVKRVASTP